MISLSTGDIIAVASGLVSLGSALSAWRSYKISKDVFDRDNNVELHLLLIEVATNITSDNPKKLKTKRVFQLSAVGDRFIYLQNIQIKHISEDGDEDLVEFSNQILYKEKCYNLTFTVDKGYRGLMKITIFCTDQLNRKLSKEVNLDIYGDGTEDIEITPEKILNYKRSTMGTLIP